MAAKTSETCLKNVLVVLRRLGNTERKTSPELSSGMNSKNEFSEILKQNLLLLRQSLENDECLQGFEDIKECLAGRRVKKCCGLVNKSKANDEKNGREQKLCNTDTCKQENTDLLLSDSESIRRIFGQVCLQTLCTLRQALQQSKNTAEKNPAVDLLSISDQKIVSTIIQLIVVLGICPNLLPGVGVPVEQRSGFSHVLKTSSEEVPPSCPKCLYDYTIGMVKCLGEPSLSVMILSRHLGDILSSLLQLAYSQDMCSGNRKKEKTSDSAFEDLQTCDHHETDHDMVVLHTGALITEREREECAKAMINIIDKMYQPLVVRELLFLQGSIAGGKSVKKRVSRGKGSFGLSQTKGAAGDKRSQSLKTPQWMREVCGHLLSKCLMKKNGIQNVLRGILEGASGTFIEWKVCEAIAQLIANCPLQVQSPDEYYKCISPQVLALLHLPNAKLRQQYGRVSVQIIHAMIQRYPDLATEYITNPLMKPFLLATKKTDPLKKSAVLVDETELTQCIEDLHKVFVAAPDSNLLVISSIEGIIVPLFELYCFTKHGASHVRTAVQELLSTFFKRSNESDALILLYVLAFDELPSGDYTKDVVKSENVASTGAMRPEHNPKINLMASHCAFGYGSGGGVILIRTDLSDGDSKKNSNNLEDIFGKDGSISETRALCLVEIFRTLRKENVAGNFFLYLLQQVQGIILESDFGELQKIRSLMIFQVLALMCEKLGPSVLKNVHHMITFIDVTLSRAHNVYVEKSREESGTSEFELETLSMALGMLSALLSGAVKVEPSDYSKLQELTPLLRRIANEHVEEEITELANDLLIVILTQGTVMSERTKQARTKSKDTSPGRTPLIELGPDQTRKTPRESEQTPPDYVSRDHVTATRDPVSVSRDPVSASRDRESSLNDFQSTLRDQESTERESADFDQAFDLLCDPLLPARGHALMKLATLLKTRNAKAMEKMDVLLKTFHDNLIHDDSYIYLAAVEGLVAAADVRADNVIPFLAREFITCHGVTRKTAGERTEKGLYTGCQTNKRERPVIKRSAATRMKLGEALLRATKRCGELVPRFFECLVQAFLVGVKDDDGLIRASSLSNLGELCQLSPHTLSTAAHEIFCCVDSVLKSDESSEVRRAAVLVITLVLRGLGKKSVQVLADILKDLYQLLKLVESRDRDETTRVHAQVALGELESIMKQQLFPRQQFVKSINVLP